MATMLAMDRQRIRAWLARRERRGLTFRALSQETGVPIGTLAYWAWKLREEAREASDRAAEQAPSPFVELVPAPSASDASTSIEIALRGERRVIVAAGFDEEHLVRIVRALERC